MNGPSLPKPERVKKIRKGLRLRGVSEHSVIKEQIQRVLREIVIKRDGGCILRTYPATGACGGRKKDGNLILQAEHLITRSNAASFADSRLVVCLCVRHHLFYKKQHPDEYYRVVKHHIGKARTRLLELVEHDTTPHKLDLNLALVVLKGELAGLDTPHDERFVSRHKYKLKCTRIKDGKPCGNEVLRSHNVKIATCFDCRSEENRNKAREHQRLLRAQKAHESERLV